MENINTTHSEQVIMFLDGELESHFEQPLFSHLAANDELRGEMKDHLQIRRATSKDDEAFGVPVGITSTIFSGLGIAFPIGGSSVGGGASGAVGGAGLGWILRRFVVPFALVTVTASVTWWLVKDSYEHSTVAKSEYRMLESQNQNLEKQNTRLHEKINDRSTTDSESERMAFLQGQNERLKGRYDQATSIGQKLARENVELTSLIDNFKRESSENNSNANSSANPLLRQSNGVVSSDEIAQFEPSPVGVESVIFRRSPPIELMLKVEDPSSVSVSILDQVILYRQKNYPTTWLQLRGVTGNYVGSIGESVAESSALNNLSGAFGFQLRENIWAGIELGQENFLEQFNGSKQLRAGVNVPVTYEQQRSRFWASGFIRYSPFSYGLFTPFAQVNLGGTTIGALGRATVGTMYQIRQDWNLMGGIEMSSQRFDFQQSKFYSYKYGLTLGLSHTF